MLDSDPSGVYSEVDGMQLLLKYKVMNAGCCKILLVWIHGYTTSCHVHVLHVHSHVICFLVKPVQMPNQSIVSLLVSDLSSAYYSLSGVFHHSTRNGVRLYIPLVCSPQRQRKRPSV